ncbi:tRNA (guanine(37)-N1)-methyltransferase-like isoform X1 [Polyodon spathula]|uniref:tRNA (guanine(37)-N1)-methyltransferase-like isoform X1 n=2 Tax=Polyodon spathula TaxID=7913 RepID=UPI001B7F003C|nr:tRNA (guanine(37)-N1)-methyltransferase-like isoform X1 [Polyodon spathula]
MSSGELVMLRNICRIFNFVKPETRLKTVSLTKLDHRLFIKPASLPALCRRSSVTLLAMPEQKKRDMDLSTPPAGVRGMTQLDRGAFRKTISVPAIKVKKEVINKLMKSLKNVALQRPGIKRVVEDPDDENHRLVLLDPFTISSASCFGESEKAAMKQLEVSTEIHTYDLELAYENFKSEEVLRAVLPEGQDVTYGFSRVGHIAHMNLREHQLPFKSLIGQVIIDKNSSITSVVNKTNIIDTTYRNFQMEVLAGEDNMATKVRENSVTYEFDFSKVYWNSRLSTEHERIVSLLEPGDTVFDVFAGVGPFAIPAARKSCSVFANDLNPESYKWLQHNCKLNKVDKKIHVFNLDGRDFILGAVKEQLTERLHKATTQKKNTVHIVMNLPALAIEFLDAFKNLLENQPSGDSSLPFVHCYGFSKHDNPARDIQERAEGFLGTSLEGHCTVHLVRNVAPNKEMMCISFQVPPEVLFRNRSEEQDNPEEPAPKRQKCDGPDSP